MSQSPSLAALELICPRMLARLLNVDPSTIWKMQRDGRLPPKRIIAGIGGWLRSDIEALLTQPPQQPDRITAKKR